jgi:pimeloyl-ACP methyl ester carboxylesterase
MRSPVATLLPPCCCCCFAPTEALRWLTTQEQCWYDRVEDRYYNPTSDAYLAMLVHEVKPWVDAHYRILPGRQHTSLMGSSMGGLVSLYALQRYPEVGCCGTLQAVAVHLQAVSIHGRLLRFIVPGCAAGSWRPQMTWRCIRPTIAGVDQCSA